MSFEKIIFKNLIHNEEYIRRIFPYLKEDYFHEKPNKIFFNLISEYFIKYNSVPKLNALKLELEKKSLIQEDFNICIDILKEIKNYEADDEKWLMSETEKFCQDKALYNAIMKSINIIDGSDKMDKGAIPNILQDALGVSFDTNIGHDWIENAEQRYEFYHEDLERIPFDLEYLNKITRGGLVKKTLNIFVGDTGCGKTHILCHLTSSFLMLGKNVLYITLEMAEEKIAERIDANLLNIPISEIETVTKDTYLTKINRVKGKTSGKLIIKEYPTATVNVNHFRHLINELRMKKKFVPDIIIIDYINICTSSRIKMGGVSNTYILVKSIAEEVRGLAVEFNVPILSATQSNRSGSGNTDMDLTNVSESYGLPATVDLLIALIRTPELDDINQILFKQLKSRYEDIAKNRKFVIGVDRDRMRLYDVEESAQDNIGKSIDDKSAFDNTSFGQGMMAEKKDFSNKFKGWK